MGSSLKQFSGSVVQKQAMKIMLTIKLIFAATLTLAMVPARSALAADDLQTVLRKLDAASANFRTTSADFQFDTVTTVPIFDKDVQKGTIYYKRDPKNSQMAARIA